MVIINYIANASVFNIHNYSHIHIYIIYIYMHHELFYRCVQVQWVSFFWCASLYTDIIIIYTTLLYMINIYVYLNEDPMHTIYTYMHAYACIVQTLVRTVDCRTQCFLVNSACLSKVPAAHPRDREQHPTTSWSQRPRRAVAYSYIICNIILELSDLVGIENSTDHSNFKRMASFFFGVF